MEHRLPTAIARLGSGLAAMGALAWLLWPAPDWRLEPEPLVAFLVALGGWLSTETVPALLERKPPHPHDAALLAKLKELITPDHIAFLHDQDFAGTISPHPMRGFFALADDWRGSAYEFHDKKLQKTFAEVLKANGEFAHLVAGSTWRRGDHLSAKTDRDRDEGVSDRTRQRMREMNAKARELHRRLEAFHRLARASLRL